MENPSPPLTAISIALILALLLCGDEHSGSGQSLSRPLGLPLPFDGIFNSARVGPPPWVGCFRSQRLWLRLAFVSPESWRRLKNHGMLNWCLEPDLEGGRDDGDFDIGAPSFDWFASETMMRADRDVLPMFDSGVAVVGDWFLRARRHNWIWVSRSVQVRWMCSVWAQIRGSISVIATKTAARQPWTVGVDCWMGDRPTSTPMMAWWLLGFVLGGPLFGPSALQMDFGPGFCGSKVTKGFLYPFFS